MNHDQRNKMKKENHGIDEASTTDGTPSPLVGADGYDEELGLVLVKKEDAIEEISSEDTEEEEELADGTSTTRSLSVDEEQGLELTTDEDAEDKVRANDPEEEASYEDTPLDVVGTHSR